jgi:hypothetical protein
VTFEQIFTGRLFLLQAQKHHAQSHVRYDYEGRHFWDSEAAEAVYRILENCRCELQREFKRKSKRKSSAAKAV